jgi:hypothetical protein
MTIMDQDIMQEPGTAVATVTEAPPPAPVVTDSPASLLAVIARASTDPRVDVTKMEALMQMQERLEVRQAERAFNEAFVQMQPKLPRIKRDGSLSYPVNKNQPDGPQRIISKYATWESIDAAIRPILTEHGFALSFTTEVTGNGILIVTAILRHSAGHSTKTPGPPLPCDSSGGKNNIQGWGSAMSYGKRYAATAALNLVTEGDDDDAKLAGMAFLKSEQVEELQALIAETDTNERRFLDLFAVQHLGEIQQGAFAAAKNMLLQKRKKPA